MNKLSIFFFMILIVKTLGIIVEFVDSVIKFDKIPNTILLGRGINDFFYNNWFAISIFSIVLIALYSFYSTINNLRDEQSSKNYLEHILCVINIFISGRFYDLGSTKSNYLLIKNNLTTTILQRRAKQMKVKIHHKTLDNYTTITY